MSPAVLFTVTWRACLPGADADRFCPGEPPQSVDAVAAGRLAATWLETEWAQLWCDLAPVAAPQDAAAAAEFRLLTRYSDPVHGPAAYDAVRDIANRALSRTGFIAAAALTPVASAVRADARARAVIGAVGTNPDPWRPADYPSYEARYGALLGLAWDHVAETVERGQHAADMLRRRLSGLAN